MTYDRDQQEFCKFYLK